MSERAPIRIASISADPDPGWAWLRDIAGPAFEIAGRPLDWHIYSMADRKGRANALARWRGARALARDHQETPFDLVVSHGPWATAWTQWVARPQSSAAKHLAFSFNFTDLPSGLRKLLMTPAFQKTDALAVFTETEQRLYSDYFRIDPNKLWRAPWGVAPPINAPAGDSIEGEYFASLGGEARDYGVLCEAARACPDLQFVAVARPHNFSGLDAPANLKVLFNLPFDDAWSVIWRAKAAIIPLRSRETPCGLVTLVGGMHLGKAQVVTEAAGVCDYLTNEQTGLLVPPGDADSLAAALRRLNAEPALAAKLGAAARDYAGANCSEAQTLAFFRSALERWFA